MLTRLFSLVHLRHFFNIAIYVRKVCLEKLSVLICGSFLFSTFVPDLFSFVILDEFYK